LLGAFCCALGAAGISASAALAADAVYWSNGNGAIRGGALNGSGSPVSLFTGETSPRGVSIDPTSGKIYWGTGGGGNGDIRVGSLDGTGTASGLYLSESGPESITVDPAAGKIYWAAFGGTIRVGNLNGSGSPTTLYSGESSPVGIAIDPLAGKVYWSDSGNGQIRAGNLNGSGLASTLFSGETSPRGVAIDPAAGKIYWTNEVTSGAVRVANLNGTGSAANLFSGENGPEGVAIDPSAGKIYWTDNGSGLIREGNLSGTGTPSSLFTGENSPKFPTLLRSPETAGVPSIAGGTDVGSNLACSQGSWAANLLGAFLYRAPNSFAYQWSKDGTTTPGATTSTLTASQPGSYTCKVTATNQAGSASQTSAPHVVLPTPTITKAKIKSSKHSAKFTFKATGAPGFQCALIKKPKKHHKAATPHFKSCTSPKTYKHLKHGKYTFEVRAVSGAIAGTPATKSFKIA
jgi:hypothetical protein